MTVKAILEQKGHDAADVRGGHGRAGGEVVSVAGLCGQDVIARRVEHAGRGGCAAAGTHDDHAWNVGGKSAQTAIRRHRGNDDAALLQ